MKGQAARVIDYSNTLSSALVCESARLTAALPVLASMLIDLPEYI
jgi:hypothetical protein